MPGERGLRIAAVVPTIDDHNLRQSIPWMRQLLEAGITPVVAANSAETAAVPLPDGFVRSSDGTNGGFARTVNRGARAVEGWDWLLLLNDDLQPTAAAIASIAAAIRSAASTTPALLLFDPEAPRRVPSSAQALLGLALINEIPGRLRRRSDEHAPSVSGPMSAGDFKSFSAAAINRSAWDRVGTLSENFLFCYEDVEYARRFARTGGTALAVPVTIEHNRSKSTKSRIRVVLPAIAQSATAYVHSNGVPRPVARGLTVLALLLRVPFVFLTSAPPLPHLQGIAAGVRLAITGRPAHLPAFSPTDR